MTKQKKEETPVTEVSITPSVIENKELVKQEAGDIVKSDADIDGFIDLRQKFIAKVNAICVEGKDYHFIQGKKSLAKGGAEKIASIFKWTAKFEKDTESLEMLGEIKGLVAYKCTLVNGQFVGEGRGAAMLSKNGGDPNKTMKMAQKSAFIDAVLRASGLSDFFTQDLEDMSREQISEKPNYTSPRYSTPTKATPKQLEYIKNLCDQKGISTNQLKELKITYNTPSEMIGYLQKLPDVKKQHNEDLPIITVGNEDEELQKIADNIPF